MGMNYVDRGENVTKYFTDEDNERVISVLRDWIPARKKALQEGTELPKIPTFIALHVKRIVTNTSTRYNYREYPYRDDMISEAMTNILRYLHTFDVEHVGKRSGKINFFSWVTMCTDRSFSKKITTEEEHTYIKLRSFEDAGGFAALSDDPDFQPQNFAENTGITMDFRERIGRFEEKREAQRERERDKAKTMKDETKNKKIAKGILQFLNRGENNPTADTSSDDSIDLSSVQYDIDDTLSEMETWMNAEEESENRKRGKK